MNTFFNLNGRLDGKSFLTAFLVLFAAGIALQLVSAFVSPLIGLVGLVLIWCNIAVFGKRLHDAGYTAWLVIAIFIVFAIISSIVGLVVTPIMAPEAVEAQKRLTELQMSGQIGFAEAMHHTAEISRMQLSASIVTSIISSLIIGGAMYMLPTQKADNKHGPAPSSDAFQ